MAEEDATGRSPDRKESSGAESDESEVQPVQSLVSGRDKRATAGNRMSSLVEREDDEDLDLLFAENEEDEDVEFEEEDEAASDAEMDSSTDEDDQGPTKGEEDLTGEQELQKQERVEKRKRKAQGVLKRPGVLRKRVKIDESATQASSDPNESNPKPKKKSERVSWMHAAADAPTRISSRKQTVQNREIVHKRLLDNEKQRARVMRQMEEAQRRKDAQKAKPLTQAERLDEAAKIERKNAKSLNRWEEAEKMRAQEQKAKLEALHNRQLNGPVISWWSGMSRWFNGRITEVGAKQIREAGHQDIQVRTAEEKPSRNDSPQEHRTTAVAEQEGLKEAPSQVPKDSEPQYPPAPTPAMAPDPVLPPPPHPQFAPATDVAPSRGFLDGIHAYAALPVSRQPEFTGTAHDDRPMERAAAPQPPEVVEPLKASPPPAPKAPEPEFLSRSLVILQGIDGNASKLPELQDHVLLKKKGTKLHKIPAETCAITSQPAKFRDPRTGLPYANTYAYGQIQQLQKGTFRWSNLLGCYVGSSHVIARGVPERFWRKPA